MGAFTDPTAPEAESGALPGTPVERAAPGRFVAADAAVAHVEIRSSVRLPRGTRAELRQTTVLGDIYLALLPPADGAGPLLGDGDTISLRDTDPGPQVEEMLQRIATFVNGGSITRLQDAIARLDSVLPDNAGETRELAAGVAADVHDAAAGTAELDRTLAATANLSQRLHEMRDRLGFMFSDTARRRLERVPQFMTAVLNVVIEGDVTKDAVVLLQVIGALR
ncbi:MlaD family protein [Nocardia nova]